MNEAKDRTGVEDGHAGVYVERCEIILRIHFL